MDWVNLIPAIAVLIVALVLLYLFRRQKEELDKLKEELLNHQSFQLMNQNLQGLHGRLDELKEAVSRRLETTATIFDSLNREIGALKELSTSVKELQNFLRSPKLRGNIGEQVLKELLREVLPQKTYRLQYRFKDGQIVDAVIKTSRGLIPIDSKFPLDVFKNYLQAKDLAERKKAYQEFRRALKNHIRSIAKKYILTTEGTLNFAVMYIPSEAVYHQLITKDEDLLEYGYKNRVFIVSPNSFYYFLHIILTGLNTERISEMAQEILATLEELKVDSEKLGQQLSVLGKHIRNAYFAFDPARLQHEKIDQRLDQLRKLKNTKSAK
ncbi:DNA recombination protein RmuC [bacterium]|nr:DNA recombination protein RmuC [bacterium]